MTASDRTLPHIFDHRSETAAVTMAPNPDLWIVRDKLFGHFERGIRRTVVHDQDLEIGGQLAADLEQFAHMTAQSRFAVVDRQHDGQGFS